MQRILLYIALLYTTLAFSQKEASVWYFGQNAGMKFNDDGSVTPLTDGKINTMEGCSSIADINGNLLFYTDGVTVWNKAYQIMENGTDLYGNSTTTQSTLIVPKPGSNNMYYIFTCDWQGHPNGLCYSEVDLSYNNGLGKITFNKNILLATPLCEKVCAVINDNEDGYWVVAHGFGNNSFLAYNVTAAGINMQAIVSNIGKVVSVDSDGSNAIGYMKFSPSGKKLISCNNHLNNVELYDFDASSGLVTNPRTVSKRFESYGVEFSPSESIAYMTGEDMWAGIWQLWQYDLTVSNIPSSEVVLYKTDFSSTQLGALQMGINGKIYGSTEGSNYLLTIDKPDILGVGCDFQLNGASISPEKCLLGLPNFVQSLFRINPEIDFKNSCQGDTSFFSLTIFRPINSAVWDFGDGSTTSSQTEPLHKYAKSGNYTVTVTATLSTGKAVTASKSIVIYDTPVANAPDGMFACDDNSGDGKEQFNLTTQTPIIMGSQSSPFNITYHLSQSDADSKQNVITDTTTFVNTTNPQTIYARVENQQTPNCFATTNFQLIVNPKPVLALDDTYTICEGKSIKIIAPQGFSSYDWSNGVTDIETIITKAGNYSLTVTENYETTACEAIKGFTVYNSNLATITRIDIQDWTDNHNTISVQATGDGEYEYSIVGVHYQDSPVFNDLPGGSYTVYVNDKKGCGITKAEVFLLIYPKFFTPNGDDSNDDWHIKYSFYEPEMTLFIYDRYGKLITELSGQDKGWDGTYNGDPVPADDYWFIIKRANGKEYKGHFSLKR